MKRSIGVECLFTETRSKSSLILTALLCTILEVSYARRTDLQAGAFDSHVTGESEKQIEGRKQELSDLITALLRHHPCLHYFQGFHDIAQVLLLVLGTNQAAPLLARLSLLRIRDFMLPSMSASESHLRLLPAILYAADPKLCGHLSELQPYFALAATLTLYAHDIEEYGGISRLFDFLLAREAVVSLYMYATVSHGWRPVMRRKPERPLSRAIYIS